MAGEKEVFGTEIPITTLNFYRQLVRSFLDSHQYSGALFWADKLVSLSNGIEEDVFVLAQCFLHTKQYHRAAHCIISRNLHLHYPSCRYLAAKCHYESKEFQEALSVLEGDTSSTDGEMTTAETRLFPIRNVDSSIKLLKGKIYEAMDNRNLATECFKEAVQDDVYCYEAFEALVKHQMLSADEERELLDSLPFAQQCRGKDEAEFISFLYENKLNKYSKTCKVENSLPVTKFSHLTHNLDVVVNEAERYYYMCNYRECFRVTSLVLEKDPFHSDCLPIHIACLVELKKSNSLFKLAHKLVDLYPESALSWFAVGCYYLLTCKSDPARRYLSKSTICDRVFGPAWLAYGHSFAVENEHDQAMAAYFRASKLMKGCHLPLLYIGLEYGLTNNAKLAEKFFIQALTIAPEDPFVLHEMGVIAYQNQDYDSAEKNFRDALDKVQTGEHTIMVEKWEPLLNNLGHVCRKLKKYEEALDFHLQALILSPQNASTFTSIGYVHSLMGNSALAVDYFHKALGIRRDDTFSTAMLSNVIEQLMNEVVPCEGATDEVPAFEVSNSSAVPAFDMHPMSITAISEMSSNVDMDMDMVE